MGPKEEEVIDFRSLVAECASMPKFVQLCNRAMGTRLVAPLAALLDGRFPDKVSSEEREDLGMFIVFVHQAVWAPSASASAIVSEPTERCSLKSSE